VNELDNPRPEKVAVVEEVRGKLSSSSAAILTEYRGLKVQDLATLRRSLREVGGEYRIYKNTLVRFAARDLGLDSLQALLEGPTAITFVDGDAVSVAKALRDFARTNPSLVVKGGLLGSSVLDAKSAAALADLPSREVLLSRIAGGLAAPMVQFAGLLQALPRNLAYGLKALIEKNGGVPETAEAAPEPAPAVADEAASTDEAPSTDEAANTEPTADEAPGDAAAADEPTADEAPAAEAEPVAAPEPVAAAEAPAAEAAAPEAAAPESESEPTETSSE
jgi:large subunit ribosomal protein L10